MERQRVVENEKKRRIFIVSIWYLLSLLIALFVPNITFVIRYLGALAAAFMFIFPGKKLILNVLNFKFFTQVMAIDNILLIG